MGKLKLPLSVLLLGTVTTPAFSQDINAEIINKKTQEEIAVAQANELSSQIDTNAGDVIELPVLKIFGEQNPYLERTNKTALKIDADQMNVPFTTNVLNKEIIEDLKAEKLDKVFNYIPGFSNSTQTANGFTIRGHSADLQNIQVDGLPGLTNRFGSPTTANIESVEVIKGPASVLYGWMDPGGMVNLVTKKPRLKKKMKFQLHFRYSPNMAKQAIQVPLTLLALLTKLTHCYID